MRVIFLAKDESSKFKMYSKSISDVNNWKENIQKLFELPNIKICELLIIDDKELKWLDTEKFYGNNFHNYLVTLNQKLFKIPNYFGNSIPSNNNKQFFLRVLPMRYCMIINLNKDFIDDKVHVEDIMISQFETDENNCFGVKFPILNKQASVEFIRGFLTTYNVDAEFINNLPDFVLDNGIENLSDFIKEYDDAELIYGMLLNSFSILNMKESEIKEYLISVIREIEETKRKEERNSEEEKRLGSGFSDIYDFGSWND